jgi:ribosomal protein L37E
MEKIYKCDFCGTNAFVVNTRGGCVSCGAPIKRENIEMLEEKVERYNPPYHGVCSGSTLRSSFDYGACSASYIKLY